MREKLIVKTSKITTNSKIFNSKKPEYIVLVLFVVLYCTITAFHEPWFDEAQAWEIGKCASLYDLLFEIPHYEGHPAFWSLILAIPAKLGVPFEIGLKTIGFLVSTTSVLVILFKTKYPRGMRLVLPFTYFIFYQYGVIVRPYCLMVLAFLLLTMVFPERHKNPWRFVLVLMLLCCTGAYAIIMAGGIALCYVWDVIREKGIKRLFTELFTDRRTVALFALLLLALFLIIQILPKENTLSTFSGSGEKNSILQNLLVTLFTFIGESTLTTGSWFSADDVLVQTAEIHLPELLIMVLLGIVLWFLIIGVSSKKLIKFFAVPYIMLALFASFVYFGVHHIGVVYALLLFWTGILFQDENRYEIGRIWIQIITKNEKDKKLITYSVSILAIACLIIPVYWNITSCICDVKWEYGYGRSMAKWIRDYELENCSFFTTWGWKAAKENDSPEVKLLAGNTYLAGNAVVINAYFDHNLCQNLNGGRDDEAYMHYKVASWEEQEKALQEWKEMDVPDVLLARANISAVYDDVSYHDYSLVRLMPNTSIWKGNVSFSPYPVFIRNEIMEEHDLSALEIEGLNYRINGLSITDEMREQFENGIPAEEILKPYLDAMFGEQK